MTGMVNTFLAKAHTGGARRVALVHASDDAGSYDTCAAARVSANALAGMSVAFDRSYIRSTATMADYKALAEALKASTADVLVGCTAAVDAQVRPNDALCPPFRHPSSGRPPLYKH